MTDLVRLSRAYLGVEEKNALLSVLDEGYLGMGQEVKLFEQELELFLSSKTKVACVNTGTSALQLALQAVGIGRGDEVLIPSITYLASYQATSATGAIPISCDINLETGYINLQNARKKLSPHTKAIMPVHYAGDVGCRTEVFNFAKKHQLRVVEDAAHAFGGKFQHKRVGEDGDILCFSFDGIKNITCGEGGAVVSADLEIINRVQNLRLLGVQKDTEKRYSNSRSWDFEVTEQGWRYHMSNLNAAIGRAQLRKIDFFLQKKQRLLKCYLNEIKECPITYLKLAYENMHPHIFPILVSKKDRDPLRDFLKNNKIETGIHYKANHRLKKYQTEDCPVAEEFSERVISLPFHVGLTETDQKRVIHSIQAYYRKR